MTQTYLSSQAITAPFVPREASAAGRLRSNAETAEVGTGTNFSGLRAIWELVWSFRCGAKFMYRVHNRLRTIRRNVVATSLHHDASAASGEAR